ncbi:MAG: ectonucleotide pyrophosphatase/phosphodiesterase [Lysobacteraceae bacterium]
MHSCLRCLLFLSLLMLAACAGPASLREPREPAPSLLLISLDGTHPDYLGRGNSPNLDRLAREGVIAQWMTPSYPALTFPNHYTLVTGLRPDHHGIVHNTMEDAALGRFTLADRTAVGDGRWWGGEPIWVGAQKAGLNTANLAWPGSEADIAGVRPTRWLLFDAKRSLSQRVEIVSGWLTEPAATRPAFVALYIEHLDSAGHTYGPDSPELAGALRRVDAALGELFARLSRAGTMDRTNIVIVSDHGMATVPAGQVVITERMLDPEYASLVSTGQVVGFNPRPGHRDEAERALLGRHEHYECWRKEDMPERWRFGRNPRVPAITCQMDEGWDALPSEHAARRGGGTRGSHGFDPTLPSMRAIFLARGPSFREGITLPGFDNVDVYPLLTTLLGIESAEHDGNAQTLLEALRDSGL